MQALLVMACKAAWPIIEKSAKPAICQLLAELVVKAKATSFTGSYAILNDILPPLEDSLAKLLAPAA